MGRNRRHEGLAGMASGRAEQDAAPHQRQAAPDLHSRRRPYLGSMASNSQRTPSGHPEAFLEAFANIYTAVYDDIIKRSAGQAFEKKDTLYPNVGDGVDGMNFITQCVASCKEGGHWLNLKHELCRK
ncbi:MAG: hypothetical protein U0744_09300 [Gemmataceae bacterium]